MIPELNRPTFRTPSDNTTPIAASAEPITTNLDKRPTSSRIKNKRKSNPPNSNTQASRRKKPRRSQGDESSNSHTESLAGMISSQRNKTPNNQTRTTPSTQPLYSSRTTRQTSSLSLSIPSPRVNSVIGTSGTNSGRKLPISESEKASPRAADTEGAKPEAAATSPTLENSESFENSDIGHKIGGRMTFSEFLSCIKLTYSRAGIEFDSPVTASSAITKQFAGTLACAKDTQPNHILSGYSSCHILFSHQM